MNTRFETLFTVGVSHAYYSSECEDFEFFVTPDTARLLRNGKLIAKMRKGTLYVLFEVDEVRSPLARIGGKTLRFGLKLLNPFFSHITEWNPDSFIPFYRNSTNPDHLDSAEKTSLVGRLFSHGLSASERPVTVTLKNSGGGIVRTETIAASNDRSAMVYDLADAEPGVYTVEETYSLDAETIAYYFDDNCWSEGIFGIVEITVDNGFYTAPPNFEIDFSARKEVLKYYVVARNYSDADIGRLTVLDTGFTEDGRPEIKFTKVASDAFTAADISAEVIADAGSKVVMFKSEAAVARREKSRKKIQLSKNGEVIIAHLPQPGMNRASADLIIQLSKP